MWDDRAFHRKDFNIKYLVLFLIKYFDHSPLVLCRLANLSPRFLFGLKNR
jgi:hypothetical protein